MYIDNISTDSGVGISDIAEIQSDIAKARSNREKQFRRLKNLSDWVAYLEAQPDLDANDIKDLASTRRAIALVQLMIKLNDGIIEVSRSRAQSIATCIEIDHQLDALR